MSSASRSDIPVIRAVAPQDFDQIHALAQVTGGGMTNLPMDRGALRARVETSLKSFEADAHEPGGENYMLVLDQGGRILGTAGIFSAIGLTSGFVNYRINSMFHFSEQVGKRISRKLLVPTHDFTGCSEVASLFLSPDARGGGFGKLLARSRYLFVAQAPQLFAEHMCAELRGWRAPDGGQPFWEAVGRHFFDMDFESADQHNSRAGNQFISDLMPIYPIYIALLPEAARNCIGKPHDSARPAYEMLLREGFRFTGYVDVFDAGPLVEAQTSEIRTVRESRMVTAALGSTENGGEEMLVASGTGKNFRCIRTNVHRANRSLDMQPQDKVQISEQAAAALNIASNDPIRIILWKSQEGGQANDKSVY